MVGINFYLANPGICRALLEENVFIFRLGLSTLLTNSKKKKTPFFHLLLVRSVSLKTSRRLVFLKKKRTCENCYSPKFAFGTFVSRDVAVVLFLVFSTAFKKCETVIRECKK